MSTYLERRGAKYYFRRVVPLELRPYFKTATGKPRAEFMFSLNTSERSVAEERLAIETVKHNALFKQARARLEADEAAARARATQSPEDAAREEAEWEAMELRSREAFEAECLNEEREPLRRALIRRLSEPTDTLSPAELAMRDIVDEREFDLEGRQAREQEFAARWKEGAAEAARRFAGGEHQAPEAAPAYPRLMNLFDGYAAERKPNPATVKRWKKVIDHLIAHLGHDDASRITPKDVVRWKEALLTERTRTGVRDPRTVREAFRPSSDEACVVEPRR